LKPVDLPPWAVFKAVLADVALRQLSYMAPRSSEEGKLNFHDSSGRFLRLYTKCRNTFFKKKFKYLFLNKCAFKNTKMLFNIIKILESLF